MLNKKNKKIEDLKNQIEIKEIQSMKDFKANSKSNKILNKEMKNESFLGRNKE